MRNCYVLRHSANVTCGCGGAALYVEWDFQFAACWLLLGGWVIPRTSKFMLVVLPAASGCAG